MAVPASFSFGDGAEAWPAAASAPWERDPLRPLPAPLQERQPQRGLAVLHDASASHSDDEQLSPPVMRMDLQPAAHPRDLVAPLGTLAPAAMRHRTERGRAQHTMSGPAAEHPESGSARGQLACERAQRVLTARDLAHARQEVDQLQEQARTCYITNSTRCALQLLPGSRAVCVPTAGLHVLSTTHRCEPLASVSRNADASV